MVGVELDSTTATIAKGLYPNAAVRHESFADTPFEDGHFDAAIGNVPFSNVVLHDRRHNRARHSMHNHFIVKSLDLIRPGGVVMVLSSRHTLDAQNTKAREAMYERADLVGAVRLPSGAFRRSAGTEVVTDLLIFRKRLENETPQPFTWREAAPQVIDGTEQRINQHFLDTPSHVLGEFAAENGQYAEDLVVRADDLHATAEKAGIVLDSIVEQARAKGLTISEVDENERAERLAQTAQQTELWDGTIVAGDKDFRISHQGFLQELKVPRTQQAELRDLLALRDGAKGLLEEEARTLKNHNDAALDEQRAAIRAQYEAYVAKYGPINRFTERRTGRYEKVLDDVTGEVVIDPETGQPERGPEIMARVKPPVMKFVEKDPHGPLVFALENFDESTQEATPAALLVKRQLVERPRVDRATSPADAIALSLDQIGKIDVEHIAHLLAVTPDEAREQLAPLVFEDPMTGDFVTDAEYLSGNVRDKLDQAREAAETEDRYRKNVEALQDVLPAPIGIDEIEAKLGAVWISPEIHQQFLRELLEDPTVKVANPVPGTWKVKGRSTTILASSEWGTDRRSAIKLAELLMSQSAIRVTDTIKDVEGTREVFNPVETTAAQEKAEALQERFAEWVWEDPERANALADQYNRQFNSIVLRDYTESGKHLALPGLSEKFTLKPHQRAAVARMIAEPAVGLFHQVGAGKTLEMVVGATELKRMGMINKPAVVVPNHMLEQFSREWLEAYPQARVLTCASHNLTGDKRRVFIARAAANDWDAVIMTQEAFKRINLSSEFQADYLKNEIATLDAALESAREKGSIGQKAIEKKKLRAEEEWRKALDGKRDVGISWEDTGIDYLLIDEAHMYKNLRTPSDIPGAAIEGSKAATDLHMKLEWLRAEHGERVVTMATATPIANSITEAHVMQRYLRPDVLERAGVEHFDAWAATFASVVDEMEMGPSGDFRIKSRFAQFQNVPEMLKMWHVFADVKTAADLNLDGVPEISQRPSDGKRAPEIVTVPPTQEIEDYLAEISERTDLIAAHQVNPSADNMLKVSMDGRQAALDIRLVKPGFEPTGLTKLEAVASRILRNWDQNRDNEYLIPDSNETSPVRGSLQLVFGDLGTPSEQNKGKWHTYGELKRLLVAGGMPADSIRFMHEAKNDKQKGQMFAAARAGHISVLIGSTAKMGVGTNVQTRVTALHHLDCPWRPADLEQRDGRGIRQMNQNAEVDIYRYVVAKSFDTYLWQTIERKARFISQIMNGSLDSREVEDIGDTTLSATEAKALASDNPLLLEKAQADSEWNKLRRQATAHTRAQAALTHRLQQTEEWQRQDEQTVAELETALPKTRDTTGDKFAMKVGGYTYTDRARAAGAIANWARENPQRWRGFGAWNPTVIGEIGGHEFQIEARSIMGPNNTTIHQPYLSLKDVPYSSGAVDPDSFAQGAKGIIQALESKPRAIAGKLEKYRGQVEHHREEAEKIRSRIGAPFKHADALKKAEARVREIEDKLAKSKPKKDAPQSEALTDVAGRPTEGLVEPPPAWKASFPSRPQTATPHTGEQPRTVRIGSNMGRDNGGLGR